MNNFSYFVEKINLYKKQIVQLVKFSIVGVINTAVDFAVFFLFYSVFRISYSLSQVFGYTSGMINSFIMNKKWTFEDKTTGKVIITKLLKFVITNLVSLGSSIVVLKLSKTYLSNSILIAKILATLCAQMINYLSYKYWVFNKF
ncbi:GtrA family protein [Caldicellulosiruptor kronotskyensis 2002]|uniref:GtrA family protein n=2 Tax=Caldicellulosiruptor TaxID=44000 RepID=A4XG81_CALS8|nr:MULTISPECIES: GtrA family protein [Caldicellulosiruptor]ABP65916.1 GtrA family protein [Caldicellulosiruptor saccharolyticus DSM 8903]ADQ47082.1 GtrA family protein [Caldicellulosiruptor kronotskyensis 2002]